MKSHITILLIINFLALSGCGGPTAESQKSLGSSGCESLDGPCNGDQQAVALSGCGPTNYTVAASLGSNPAVQLIVDSGSASLAVASSLCGDCGSLPAQYNPSAAAVDTGRTAQGSYVDGSGWQGEVYDDAVAFGAGKAVHMDLVAMTEQASFLESRVCPGAGVATVIEGILGLGGQNIAAANTEAYVDHLTAAGMGNAFAVQLCEAGGNMWLGGYNPASMSAAPQFTPLVAGFVDTDGAYAVALSDMLVGGTSLQLAPSVYGSVTIDTGSSELLVPSAVFAAIATAVASNATFTELFGSATFLSGDVCAAVPTHMTRDKLDAALPSLALTFPGTNGSNFTVQLPATKSYLRKGVSSDQIHDYYCPDIVAAQGSGYSIIFGNNMMHEHIVIFDRQNQQIGFAPQVGCPTL